MLRLMTLTHIALTLLCLCWGQVASGSEVLPNQVLLALDDSGSMRSTDPQGLSKQSSEMFIRLMSSPGELAVLSFANTTNEILPLQSLSNEKLKRKAIKKIGALKRSGGQTHIEAVLRKALEVFDKGNKKGKRYLLLLTDGKIDLDNDSALDSPEETASLKNIHQELIPLFKQRAIAVHSIAFGDNTDEELLASFSSETGGLFFKIKSAEHIASTYFTIFNQIEKPQLAPISNNAFNLDETVTEATLIFKSGFDPKKIVIKDPKGRRYRRKKPTRKVRWGGNDAFLIATIVSPRAGSWKIEGANEADAKAILLTNIKLRVPPHRPLYREDEPIYLLARIDFGKTNETIPLDLRLKAQLIDGKGLVLETVPLSKGGKASDDCQNDEVDRVADEYYSGVFPFSQERRPGVYTVKVSAIADTFSRAREFTLRVQSGHWIEIGSNEEVWLEDLPVTWIFDLHSDILPAADYDEAEGLPHYINRKAPFSLNVHLPDKEKLDLPLSPIGNGKYSATVPSLPAPGKYNIMVFANRDPDALLCFKQEKLFSYKAAIGSSSQEDKSVAYILLAVIAIALVFFFFGARKYLKRLKEERNVEAIFGLEDEDSKTERQVEDSPEDKVASQLEEAIQEEDARPEENEPPAVQTDEAAEIIDREKAALEEKAPSESDDTEAADPVEEDESEEAVSADQLSEEPEISSEDAEEKEKERSDTLQDVPAVEELPAEETSEKVLSQPEAEQLPEETPEEAPEESRVESPEEEQEVELEEEQEKEVEESSTKPSETFVEDAPTGVPDDMGIDLSEIDSLINKMDKLSGGPMRISADEAEEDDDLTASLFGSVSGGEQKGLSTDEYNAIDQAIEKMSVHSPAEKTESEKEPSDEENTEKKE